MQLQCSSLGVIFASATDPVHALGDISFATRDGEFLTLVGPSGCGKTTLLRVLAGLLKPDHGHVQRISSRKDRRGDVLLVCQEDNLFPWLTVLENAAFGLEMRGVPRSRRESEARALLERLGMAGREQAYPHELSLGMKQRVAVARCFLSDPAVLLMDEPFAALDCQTRLNLQQQLLELWEQSPKTVIFVTHDVEEAILLSDRILVLSPSPASIVEEFTVDFPRPRRTGLEMTEPFLFLRRRIAAELGVELAAPEVFA